VHAGLPGLWSWRVAYQADGRFGISMITDAGDQTYLTDGATLRGYTDGALLVSEPLAGSALETLLQWTAATTLSAVASPSATIEIVERAPSTTGAARASAIEVRFADTQARYELMLDDRGRVVEATGPIDAPPVGAGRLHAVFSDFRTVDGHALPFYIAYWLDGQPLLDERVVRFIPHTPWPSTENATHVPDCAARRQPAS